MGDSWASSEHTRRAMQANRARDTALELSVRRILHGRGLRYRVDARPLPAVRCKADIIFSRVRVAVFLDGCFWHGCPEHCRMPQSNAAYWERKIGRNRARDAAVSQLLSDAGWTALRYWEHEDPKKIAGQIAAVVECLRIAEKPR